MTYEIIGLLLAGMFISGALLSYVVFYCDSEGKNKEIENLKSESNKLDLRNRESKRTIESKDGQLRSLGEMIDKLMRDDRQEEKAQYRKIQALKNRFKLIKKGQIYSGREVIEDGIKMYRINVNGVTHIVKRSDFKIVK